MLSNVCNTVYPSTNVSNTVYPSTYHSAAMPMQHTAYCNAEMSITGKFTVLYASALSVGVLIVLAAEAETSHSVQQDTGEVQL